MIKLEDVCVSYAVDSDENGQKSEQWAGSLKHVNLEVGKGEVVLLTGPSGCGKTTILRLINGLIPEYYDGKQTGNVWINGRDSRTIPLVERASIVGTVFQDPRAQFYSVDTTNELAFGCENQGIPEEDIYERIDETVERFSMESLMDRNIFELSGGEKQKIACASIDVEKSHIILMDEPSSNLDTRAMEKLKEVISIWKQQGKTIVISEHRVNYIWNLIDRMYVMRSGEIIKTFDANEMIHLGEEELAVLGLRSKRLEDPMSMETGVDARASEETIRLENFSLKRGKKEIFHIKDMKIPAHKVTAIVGTNGKGKTTLLRCLAGMEKKCKGKVVIGGRERNHRELRKLSYMVMQDVNHQLFAESVLEELLISDEKEDRNKDIEILNELNLKDVMERHPMSLSGGQKQRVAIACAVASERELLLFDEPTSGLDYTNMRESAKQFRKLCEKGKTVVIVTHDSELIRTCCDKMIYL